MTLVISLVLLASGCASSAQGDAKPDASFKEQAVTKINTLEGLMKKARAKSLDVTREETALWFSQEFLKFADWDETSKVANEYLFGVYHEPFKSQKKKLAEELPDFERKKVIAILDNGIATLEDVLSGKIVRRPVNKVDWQNIKVGEDVLLSNGKPIFLYDYFSKSVGRPLTDTRVYNDHLGAIFHGGADLYPVDHDRAINSFLLKEDGTWDEELLKEITGIPNSNVGFLLFWNSGIPDWVLKKEPEATKGRGLFTGYDIDNPLVREVWGKIARKAGELTRGKKVTQLGYILSNEPHWFFAKENWTQRFKEMNSISSYTDANFKAWLKENYDGDIAKLNQNWQTSFADFASVTYPFPIPRAQTGKPMWYDWCRYNMQRGTDWFTYIQGELRKGNPDADTSIKLMPDLFSENPRDHGIDVEALTELTSMIGDDAKTQWIRNLNAKQPEPWEAHYAYYWEEMSVAYDFMESVAPNKIHFNSENHFLSASWVRELDQPADYVRNVYWLATIQGMDANLAWWWARDPDGSPEDRMEGELNFFDPALAGSYAASANQQPQVVNEVAQVMFDLNSFSEEVMAIRKQRRPIRLFYSETSAINKHRHMTEQFELYEQLFFEGFPLGFATEKIIRKQDHKNWDAILVYKTEFVTDAEFDALQSYLNSGGTVLVDSDRSLAKNEYGQPRKRELVAGKGKLVKLNGATIPQIKETALKLVAESLPDVMLSEVNGLEHKGCTWRVVKKPGGGYLMNILNLGKNTAQLKIAMKDGKSATATDMLTRRALGAAFELKPNGVLLLEISPKTGTASAPTAPQLATPLFSEAGNDVIPLEQRSRRKWDNALIADLDQDGHQDLLLTEHSLEAKVFWNNGGKFSEPLTVVRGDTHGVAAGDYDQDGLMDLIIYHGGGGGKNPRNPISFHVSGRSIEGGEEFEDFERSRGRAVKLVDCDGDGLLDLITTAFPLDSQKSVGANHLFRNVGNGKFEFVSKLPQAKWMGFRALVTDFNNDGIPDLIFYGGADMVALQGGKGMTFSNVTDNVLGKLANTGYVSSIAEIDYDNDGDFDLFVTRADFPFDEEIDYDAEHSRFAYYVFASFTKDVPYQYDLKIDGDFHMENLQTAYPDHDVFFGGPAHKLEFKVDRHGSKDFTLTPQEAEGWPAELTNNGLYIGYLGNDLWRVGGKTKSSTAGVVLNVKSHPPVTPKKELPARLFENRGGVFVDVTEKLGISVPDQTASAAVGDFNNDGWSDIFIVRQGNTTTENEQIVLLNQGGKAFAQATNAGVVSKELGTTGCGADAFDYNEDGNLDLIYSNERGRWHLFTNNGLAAKGNNYVVVKVGASPSKKATSQGATLTLKAGGNIYRRVVGATSAAFSHSANNHLHVGLGKTAKVDEAVVRWTNGETETVRIDAVNTSVIAGQFK